MLLTLYTIFYKYFSKHSRFSMTNGYKQFPRVIHANTFGITQFAKRIAFKQLNFSQQTKMYILKVTKQMQN